MSVIIKIGLQGLITAAVFVGSSVTKNIGLPLTRESDFLWKVASQAQTQRRMKTQISLRIGII